MEDNSEDFLAVYDIHDILHEPNTESDPLEDLLKRFDLMVVMPYLKESSVTYRSLQYLKNEDLKEIIPLIGLRVEFREKLFAWRKKEFGIDDDTLSAPSKVQDWLCHSQTQSSSNNSGAAEVKDLKTLLMETSKGKAILNFYEKANALTNVNRTELINIIVEDSLFCNRSLSPKDFTNIVDEICKVFPNERKYHEYYFITRCGKRNPSGKLYSKYVNMRFNVYI